MKAADPPTNTERGQHAAPADEQLASQVPETDRDDDRGGPAHTEGTQRAEDVP